MENKTSKNSKQFIENFSIVYKNKEGKVTDNYLRLLSVKNDLEILENLAKQTSEKGEILLQFKEGSSKLEIQYRAMIREYHFDSDKKDKFYSSSLMNYYDLFLAGTKKINTKKLINDEYKIDRIIDGELNIVKIIITENDKTIWQGPIQVFEIVKKYKTKTKEKKKQKVLAKTKDTYSSIHYLSGATIYNGEDVKRNKIMDISENIDENIKISEQNIKNISEFSPSKKFIENHKMNILSGNHFEPNASKWFVYVREFGAIDNSKIRVELEREFTQIYPGNKNYLEADVEKWVNESGKVVIKIKKIKRIELNKKILKQSNLEDLLKEFK